MTYYASPAAYNTQAIGPTPAAYIASPATPPQSEGFIPYTADSFSLGFQKLGSALSNDAAGIIDSLAGILGLRSAQNQASAQAAIAANPGLIDPTSPYYQGAFIGPGGTAPGVIQEGKMLVGDIAGSLPSWLIIGGLILLAVELSPSINNLTAQRRHD